MQLKSFSGPQWIVTPLELTFDPPVGIALGVLDSPLGEADDGTLRKVVHGLSAGHAPHVEGQRVLCCLLSLQGHLGYHCETCLRLPVLALTWAAMTRCLSWMRLHLAHSQSRYLQVLLCPFSQEITPWLRHRAHLGLLRESWLFIMTGRGEL